MLDRYPVQTDMKAKISTQKTQTERNEGQEINENCYITCYIQNGKIIGDATVSREGDHPGIVSMEFHDLGTDVEYMDDMISGEQQILIRDHDVKLIQRKDLDSNTYCYEHTIHGYQYGLVSEFTRGEEELSFCYGSKRHPIHWLLSSSFEPFFYSLHSFVQPIFTSDYIILEESNEKYCCNYRLHHNHLMKHGLVAIYPRLQESGTYQSYPSRLVVMKNDELMSQGILKVFDNLLMREICDNGRVYCGEYVNSFDSLFAWNGNGTVYSHSDYERNKEIEGYWKQGRLVRGKGYDPEGEAYDNVRISYGNEDITDIIGFDRSYLIWGLFHSVDNALHELPHFIQRLLLSCSFDTPVQLELRGFPFLMKLSIGYMCLENCTQITLSNLSVLEQIILHDSSLRNCEVFIVDRISNYFL